MKRLTRKQWEAKIERERQERLERYQAWHLHRELDRQYAEALSREE